MESLSLPESSGRRARRWEGVSGPLPLRLPVLCPLSSPLLARRDTPFTPAWQSSLHWSEQ